jgi:hypothetical protein
MGEGILQRMVDYGRKSAENRAAQERSSTLTVSPLAVAVPEFGARLTGDSAVTDCEFRMCRVS